MADQSGGIPATEPVVVPAAAEATYGLWAVEAFGVNGTGVGQDRARVYARFRRWDGAGGLAPPLPGDAHLAVVEHPDLHALAAERPDVAEAMGALTGALVAYARERGKL